MTFHWLLISALTLLNLALLPYFLFLLATALSAIITRREPTAPTGLTSRFLIVIPAHDEESVIATTVQSCSRVSYPASQFSVLVIADNCSDQTARLAEEAGIGSSSGLMIRRKPRVTRSSTLSSAWSARASSIRLMPWS